MDRYHITNNGDDWQLKKEGAPKAIKNSGTKQDAIDHMKGYMENKTGIGQDP
jgi:hypothetical protein